MRITERLIDGEVYRILSIGRFSSASNGRLSDEVRAFLSWKGLTGTWRKHDLGVFLESVKEYQRDAEKLFRTKKVGVLIFVNDTEPDMPADAINVKEGDVIEIAYVGEDEKDKENVKHDFFESSDKRQYSSPYRRESEWRRPKGVR